MNLTYLSGFYKLDERSTLAASLRYFSLGAVQFTDNNYQSLGIFNPNEYAVDFSYAKSFGPGFALGGSVRFIYSNLFSGNFSTGGAAESGKAVAADISALYKKDIVFLETPTILSFGMNISNIGTKMNYSMTGASLFLPAKLDIGTAVTMNPNEDCSVVLAMDFHKLLVPTQPILDQNGNLLKGKDPNRSVPTGIIGSFNDAPNGFPEEIKEIAISTGIEFKYKDALALRAGYNYQNPEKGDSKYFTIGVGFKYNIFSLDFAYLAGTTSSSPLANTLRFGLQAWFGSKSK